MFGFNFQILKPSYRHSALQYLNFPYIQIWISKSTDVNYDFQKCGEHVAQTDHGNTMGGQAVVFDTQEATGTQVPFPCQGSIM